MAQDHEHGHDHDHDHDHSHSHGHDHGISASSDRRWLLVALAVICTFMAGEVVVGLMADSLALLSDAAHMLTDAASIILALVAIRLAARPPRGGYTFGLKRAEILSAQANGLTMLILAAWLLVEAVQRLIDPPRVAGVAVTVTAVVGMFAGTAATWAISKANRSSLNVEGAFQHMLTDLLAFLATAVAGVIMLTTGFMLADPLATLVVVVLLIRSGAVLVYESGKIFLEAAPKDADPPGIGTLLAGQPGVAEVHDLHVWQITSGQPALSAHVLVGPGHDCHATRARLEQLLLDEYGIDHTTLQVDHAQPDQPDPGTARERHCNGAHGAVYRGDCSMPG